MGIALTLAALNDLPVKVAEIHNTYITAPVTKKIWKVLDHEFVEDAGRKSIVVCDLYGLKSKGSAFRNHLSECINHFGFLLCPSDLDLLMKHMEKTDDGFDYYAYVIIYLNYVIVIHHDADSGLNRIYKYFKMNPSSICDPNIYLVANLKKMILKNRVWAWLNSPSRYVKESVANVKKYLAELDGAR